MIAVMDIKEYDTKIPLDRSCLWTSQPDKSWSEKPQKTHPW